jgi:hypothetical protein
MPNWCNNTLELQHRDPAMIERAKTAFAEGRFLAEFVPVPQELIDTVSGYVPEQEALEAQQAANREKYGYSTWYEFCVNEWGTKWDVGGGDGTDHTMEDDGGHRLSVSFESAWSPPCAAYEKLVELGFEVKAFYYEPGMAFAGVWDNGSDDYYEYGGLDSKGIEETLPVELDEMFCISEDVAQWEAENAEEEEE